MQNLFAPNIFKGKNVLITGCTSGIGRETSILLSSLGANLILVGRNKEKIDSFDIDKGVTYIIRHRPFMFILN